MTHHSTSALSAEEHADQDKVYSEGHEYDYLIIGSGIAALTAGCLLANAGHKVCMLEAHDSPGGYAHTFHMGDYSFCAQIHYIWGCGPGDSIYEFLKKCGLEKDITFNSLDPDGYDMMSMPDGKKVMVPYGYDKLADNIEAAYPGHKPTVEKFLKIVDKIHAEERRFPSMTKINWMNIIPIALKFPTLAKYRKKTVEDVLNQCKVPKEIQTVLFGNTGDMGSPPNEQSILGYAGLMGGYNTGAYYPTKHFKYVTERYAKFISDHEGCDIFYETRVSKINVEGKEVTSVETTDGKTFTAKNYICNADPQGTAKNLIGWDKVPKSFRPNLSYEYARSSLMIYMGLKDIDLRKHGFGNFNVWHHGDWDINKEYENSAKGEVDKTWSFISTTSLHSDEPGATPEGGQIMEIAVFTEYDIFKKLKDQDPKLYRQRKMEMADKHIDIIEQKYIPDFRKYIAIKVVGSPLTNEDYVLAPFGNAYGSRITPEQMTFKRLKADTPWKNFWWCNASSGYAGFYGTSKTGMSLYMKLTGDKFFDESKVPSDKELQDYARSNYQKNN